MVPRQECLPWPHEPRAPLDAASSERLRPQTQSKFAVRPDKKERRKPAALFLICQHHRSMDCAQPARSSVGPSPNFTAFIRRRNHGRVSLAAKCLLKLRQIRQRPNYAVFPGRMRIGLHHDSLLFNADRIASPLPPCDKELLFRGETIDVRRPRFAFKRFLVSEECELHAPQVADALAQHHLAVVVDAGLDEVVVKLVRDARAALLKLLQIAVSPPVSQVSHIVIPRALVVEAVGYLVAHHHPDRTVVHGVDSIVIEARWLQNSGGKNNLVP